MGNKLSAWVQRQIDAAKPVQPTPDTVTVSREVWEEVRETLERIVRETTGVVQDVDNLSACVWAVNSDASEALSRMMEG